MPSYGDNIHRIHSIQILKHQAINIHVQLKAINSASEGGRLETNVHQTKSIYKTHPTYSPIKKSELRPFPNGRTDGPTDTVLRLSFVGM